MDWDLSSYFSKFDGPDYRSFKAALTEDLGTANTRLSGLGPLAEGTRLSWTTWIELLEDLTSRFVHLSSYLECLCAADATHEGYAQEYAWLSEQAAVLHSLSARFNSRLGQIQNDDFDQLINQPALKDAAYHLSECRTRAQFQMDDPAEELASELNVNGINAWSQLYDNLSGQLKFNYVDENGQEQTAPMGQRVSLTTGSNREVRISAFHGSNAAWAEHEATCNAALNALAGTRHTLDRRRGSHHFLDEACRVARVEPPTLDAMFQAIDDTLDLPRKIMAYRSKQMGIENPGYYDLYAPLGLPEQESISWESGTQLVQDAFDTAYPDLGAFNREILEKRWVDYQPRDSKRPGGFCTGSNAIRESRIFMTFKDTMTAVTTYAHEVGHAWHSRVMADQRTFANDYPMTLAESASTFAELLLSDGVLSSPDFSDSQKLTLLDSDATRILAFLLDIPVRYRWEKRFYEERQQGVVSVSRMKALMVEEQQKQFGETLSEDGYDPYFWCSKLHFYIDGIRFYNFPYTFGYLLSVSLFARFKAEGSAFLPQYETFLKKSGSMSCEQVIRETLGEDVQDPAFWHRAIESLNEPFTKLKALLN